MKWSIKVFLMIACLSGCAMSNSQKLYALPESGIVVIGDKIYHDEKLIAELLFLGKRESCKGFAIFYYQHNKEVWIFPEEGWHIINLEENKTYSTIMEINEQLGKATTITVDGKLITDFTKIRYSRGNIDIADIKVYPSAFDIQISEDGKYIYFKTHGIFFNTSHKYLVEHGILK